MEHIRENLGDGCVDFTKNEDGSFANPDFGEEAAMCSEEVLEYYLEHGDVAQEMLPGLIASRRLFPCYFGSALKMEGVREFLEGFDAYVRERTYPESFGARVFKLQGTSRRTCLTYRR